MIVLNVTKKTLRTITEGARRYSSQAARNATTVGLKVYGG